MLARPLVPRFPTSADDTAALPSSWRTFCCPFWAVIFQPFHSGDGGTLTYRRTHTYTSLYLLLTLNQEVWKNRNKNRTKLVTHYATRRCSWASTGVEGGTEEPVFLGSTRFVCFFTTASLPRLDSVA